MYSIILLVFLSNGLYFQFLFLVVGLLCQFFFVLFSIHSFSLMYFPHLWNFYLAFGRIILLSHARDRNTRCTQRARPSWRPFSSSLPRDTTTHPEPYVFSRVSSFLTPRPIRRKTASRTRCAQRRTVLRRVTRISRKRVEVIKRVGLRVLYVWKMSPGAGSFFSAAGFANVLPAE